MRLLTAPLGAGMTIVACVTAAVLNGLAGMPSSTILSIVAASAAGGAAAASLIAGPPWRVATALIALASALTSGVVLYRLSALTAELGFDATSAVLSRALYWMPPAVLVAAAALAGAGCALRSRFR